jgi:hypothetical protein
VVEKSGKRNRKILWIVLVIEVICLAGLVIVFLVNNDEEEPVKVDSLIDMASEAIQAVEGSPNIPGFTPHQVLAQVEEEGFDCAIPRVDDKDRVIWKCEKTEGDVLYQVLVLGRDEDSVDMIDANFNQSGEVSDEAAVEFLCDIATLPFGGEGQAESCQWIGETLPTISEVGDLRPAKFNGIDHLLYGVPEARSLELGSLP